MALDTRRLQRLVESLLDFSRMEAGRKAYDLRPLDAGTLVRDVVEEFRTSRRDSSDRIRLTDADSGLEVRGDAAALSHALWNLLDNAVKYSAAEAPVDVMVRRSGDGVQIAVEDRGPGIPAAEQGEIFGRFVRGRHAVNGGVPGTGLGLALVSHVVAAHQGRVTCESREGTGSTFTIWLPTDANRERLSLDL
jgi:signal transduction histidine kinase